MAADKAVIDVGGTEVQALFLGRAHTGGDLKQASWGPYQQWFLAAQQGPIAVRKIYEEIEGKLKSFLRTADR